VLQGYCGIDGVALSVPSIVGSRGVERVLDVPLDDQELAHPHSSAEALRAPAKSIGR